MRERRGGDDGRQRLYRLDPAPLRQVAEWARTYEAFWSANLASLKQHLESTTESAAAREVLHPAHGRQ